MSQWSQVDREMMEAAFQQAIIAQQENEIPVGAIVVMSDEIIGYGHNQSIKNHDPTAHAEVMALRMASQQQKNYRLTGASLFVTLEPCAMCVGAILQARLGRVIFGAYDSKAGALGSVLDLSQQKGLNHRFEAIGGLYANKSRHLLQSFFQDRRIS